MLFQATYADAPEPPAPREPGEEVLPGVRWGRTEWVPSVAYKAFMLSRAQEVGDGCEVTHDLATSIYRAFMASRRPWVP